MDSPGLGWLADRGWPGCLVFARGVSEDQVLRAFGADPDEAVLREPGEPVPAPEGMTDAAPVIRVGQVGDRVIVIEEDEPPQGIRPEVLRRVSAGGGAAVALHWDIGKFNHEFGYAEASRKFAPLLIDAEDLGSARGGGYPSGAVTLRIPGRPGSAQDGGSSLRRTAREATLRTTNPHGGRHHGHLR